MKHILSILIISIAMTTVVSAQSLTERQKHLATMAALEAQGDLVRLEPAIIDALDGGVSINEIKEAFSQLYAYTGFPRSLNALGVLSKVLEGPKENWIEGKPWSRPSIWNNAGKALKNGTEIQTRLSGKPFDYNFCPQNDYYLKSHLFGDIFAGDLLCHADREIVTVAALSALKGVEPQLAAHKAGAVNMGNPQSVVDELCDFLSKNGLTYTESSSASISNWPKGRPNDAYAQYFTGNSYLAPIQPKNLGTGDKTVQGYSNVTFEPGCRNNWHIHHGAHQILICVSGEGLYQEWGKPAIKLRAGDIIDIPEGVKHWHGATKGSWFQHLASHVHVGDPESNEWLEPVSDEQYASANTASANDSYNPSFKEIVSSRFACKKFSGRQISKKQLDAILEAGRLAPTAKNLQEQRIYVVQSAEALAKIDANTPCRYGAPTCLVVAFDKNNVFTYPGGKRDSGVEDASIVATHMILAAESVGVNSCWINYFDPEKLAADLGLPENEEILMILDLGYAAEGTGPLKTHFSRKPIEETVTYL